MAEDRRSGQSGVLGLLALMEIQASRLRARTGPDGAFIPVTEQDRARWDHLLIRRGLDALARAEMSTKHWWGSSSTSATLSS
jgi:predicted RNA polymerase sigma factor